MPSAHVAVTINGPRVKKSPPPNAAGPRVPHPPPTGNASATQTDLPALRSRLHAACARLAYKRQSTYNKSTLLNKLLHIYDDTTGKKLTLRQLLQNPDTKDIWSKSSSNEFGRLLNGNTHGVKGTQTMVMVAPGDIPHSKKITYASMVCNYRPLKSEPHRCRLVVGGDKLTYDKDSAAPAANLLESKILFNSTISRPSARFMTIDISNFFLSLHMDEPEFMCIHRDDIPEDILQQYEAHRYMDSSNYVYFQINKGMYGLKQAAILAYKQLKTNLATHGYYPIPHSVGMWKHITRKTLFCLCIDDFGIQYHSKADADHLIYALRQFYKITIDWYGTDYCGLHLDWNYSKRYVDISMPGYIHRLLDCLKHPKPPRPVDAPHKWRKPTYSKTQQMSIPEDYSPLLTKHAALLLQSTVGSLLFYSRAVDPSMLPGLNDVSTQQAAPSTATAKKVTQLLAIWFHASDMCLHVETDAAYLLLPRARSRISGHFFLSDLPDFKRTITPNGPILTECKTIRTVVASAAKAETHGIFHNAQTALPIRYLLLQMGHPQPPTLIKTDNKVVEAFVKQEMRHKKFKTWDMRLWWLKDRMVQNHFKIFWDVGGNNWADYFTKHFAPQYHRVLRHHYLQRTNSAIATVLTQTLTSPQLRGCVGR